jgi:hypothetical protein
MQTVGVSFSNGDIYKIQLNSPLANVVVSIFIYNKVLNGILNNQSL